MRPTDVLEIALSNPVRVLLAVIDEVMLTTAAQNAASALVETQARRQQWSKEEQELVRTLAADRSA